MSLRIRSGRVFAAMCALTAAGLASHAQAQCIGYSMVPNSPGVYTPGTTDIGLYADDGTLAVSFPFPISFFGSQYTSASASSNGNLQFVTASAAYANNCLPTATVAGPAIFPFWDDLYTLGGGVGGSGTGIFTDVSGVAPNRTFVIEWRTGFCCAVGAPLNAFEIKFYEGQETFDILYGTPMSDRVSATVGCQAGGGASDAFVQLECNAAGPVSGMGLRFACLGAGTAGACCDPVGGVCSVSTAALCTAPNLFQGVGVLCSPNPCLGACCNAATGLCTVTGSAACAGGTWQGGTTGCSPNPCPQPPNGGCCLANTQTCVETNRALCAQQSGSYSGDNTTCATSACPFGACCMSCVGCFVQTASGCVGLGGTYAGNGSTCGSSPCTSTAPNLVVNGDFESGSFSGWTQFGDTGFTAVNTGAWVNITPHGGTFEAHFGPTGSVGGIQQQITANPGDQVTIGFWYANLDINNSFAAIFDGQTLVSFVDDTAHTDWTLFVFSATVTTANPTLRFETFNPPSYVMLDDISVCVAPPASTGVCCRGSTCTTTLTSAAACSGTLLPGGLAGAAFATGSACNSTGASTSPCCYADYNKVAGITVQDIFDFLNDWFASSQFANYGSSGSPALLSVQNIFDFLNAWFAGGC